MILIVNMRTVVPKTSLDKTLQAVTVYGQMLTCKVRMGMTSKRRIKMTVTAVTKELLQTIIRSCGLPLLLLETTVTLGRTFISIHISAFKGRD